MCGPDSVFWTISVLFGQQIDRGPGSKIGRSICYWFNSEAHSQSSLILFICLLSSCNDSTLPENNSNSLFQATLEVVTSVHLEWWMLSPLEAGGSLQIHSPGTGLAFDLSVPWSQWRHWNSWDVSAERAHVVQPHWTWHVVALLCPGICVAAIRIWYLGHVIDYQQKHELDFPFWMCSVCELELANFIDDDNRRFKKKVG